MSTSLTGDFDQAIYRFRGASSAQETLAAADYVALSDGSIWDREALWQEVERVLREDVRHRRNRPGRGRPATGGPGSAAGITFSHIQVKWQKLNALRKEGDRPISKQAVMKAVAVSRMTLYRVLWAHYGITPGTGAPVPWPPL